MSGPGTGDECLRLAAYPRSQAKHALIGRINPCAIDVGICNDQPFMMWAGIGLDAMTVKKLKPRKRFEKYLSIAGIRCHDHLECHHLAWNEPARHRR